MNSLRDILGDSNRPPAPEVATADDIQQYNMEWLQRNPQVDDGTPTQDDATTSLPFADQAFTKDSGDPKHKAEFPWLYDPKRGVRWDFDPIELRNLGQGNTWVGMLVQTITSEIAEVPFTITEEEDRQESSKRLGTHPELRDPIEKDLPDSTAEHIYDLLHNPNPDDNWQDSVEMWMADLLEIGSMTVVKGYPESAYDENQNFTGDPSVVEPLALQTSAPEVWTKDYHEKTGILDGFWQFDRQNAPGSGTTERQGTRRERRGYSDPTFFDTSEVVWDDLQPRSNRRYGMPPTLLVKDFLQSIDLAITQEQQYLSRGSIPSGAWVFEEWDREQVKEWKTENEENLRGKPHKSLMFAGRGGDVRFEPMSMNFKELEFTDRMRWYARVVASVFQVPTAVVGIEPEKINYHTFQGERQNFEANTLGPYLQELERVINDQLIKPHWDGYRFEFKPGMSESTRGMISERARQNFQQGITTRSEARRELGKEPIDDTSMADDGFVEDVLGPQQESSINEARVRSLRLSGVGTVNEARAEMGLDPLSGEVGEMTLAEFEAEYASPAGGDPEAEGGGGGGEMQFSQGDGEDSMGDSDPFEKGGEELPDDYDECVAYVMDESGLDEEDAEYICGHMRDPDKTGEVETAKREADYEDDGPLRNTQEWYLFDVQPEDIEELQAEIADDVEELFNDVVDDPELLEAIENLDDDSPETEKSLNDVGRVIREKLEENETAQRIADAISSHTAEQVAESMRETIEDADDAPEDAPDVAAIQSRLEDRSVEFADAFANQMSEEIRSTVAEGWEEGKTSREIAQDISEVGEMNEGWTGAERIARQEMQIAAGEARSAVADDLDKVEVWLDSGDSRVRGPHADMDGLWKWPGDSWVVDYSETGRGVKKEDVPGSSRPGIGCRCTTLIVDRGEVDSSDYGGDGTP